MKIRYPVYYGKFRCLAGSCPDTCCVDWEIRLDRETERRYKREARKKTDLGKKFRRYIKRGKLVPVNGVCPFLDKNRLCGICTGLGEGAMCRTCRQYPRHTEDYGCLQERLLLLSCPEAARLVLTEEAGRFCVRENQNMREDMEGIGRNLLKTLLRVRETMEHICLQRNLSMDQRLLMLLSLGHDVQRRLEAEDLGGIRSLLRVYEKEQAGERFLDRLERLRTEQDGKTCGTGDCRFTFMADLMGRLAELEPVGTGWTEYLEQCRKELYHTDGSRARYEAAWKRFAESGTGSAHSLERLLSYFLYSFFLTSLYDGDAYGKTKLAVYCCLVLEELFFYETEKQAEREKMDEKKEDGRRAACFLSLKRQAEICHLFARQVENSEENRERLLEFLKSGEYGIFHAAEMLG